MHFEWFILIFILYALTPCIYHTCHLSMLMFDMIKEKDNLFILDALAWERRAKQTKFT